MENDSWVKIHRKFLNWEWYDDKNTKIIFLHLLLTANFEDKSWHGIKIRRGQVLTSVEHLADDCGLTVQQTRTSLRKLKSTNEITTKSTNKNTLVTIKKYEFYQDNKSKNNKQNNNEITIKQQTNNKQSNNQITNEQQTNNNQITTTKELKKERIIVSKKVRGQPDRKSYDDLIDDYTSNETLRNALKQHLKVRFSKSAGAHIPNDTILEGFKQLDLLTQKIASEEERDNEKIEIVKKSIAGGWTTFYEIKRKEKSVPVSYNYSQKQEDLKMLETIYEN